MDNSRLSGIHRHGLSGIAVILSRLILAAVFLYASVPKLLDVPAFARAIGYYRLLPAPFHLPTALLMASLEFVLGMVLLTGVFRRTAAWMVIGLNGIFMIVMGQAMIRGIDLSCGCFGGSGPLAWEDLVRDLVFIALAVVLLKGNPDEAR